jgi:hypothetical protein
MTWIDTARSLLGRSALEQWREVPVDPALTVEQVIEDTALIVVDEQHAMELRGLIADVLARALPEERCLPLLAAIAEAEYAHQRMIIADRLPRVLGDRFVRPAIAALARWRCGVATRDETRVALEAKLAWHAWELSIEIAVDDRIAEQRLRDELAKPASEFEVPFAGALARSPVLLARFLPELVRGHHDALLVAAARAGIALD